MTADVLLFTKLHIPAARPNLVSRPRLVAHMDEGARLGRRLTLVCAPPGFGKTTLIREWVGSAGRPVAWLAVDDGDNDPARFLRYVLAALHQVDSSIGRERPDSTAPPSPQEMLIALINDLALAGSNLCLVLDDYHLISDFSVHDLVAFLLENQPPGFHLVIGTREDPPLPLARLRARDLVTELRERALRFTPTEAAAFLNQTMRLDLSPEAIAALASRTEGWITGLQLAGLALRQGGGIARGATERGSADAGSAGTGASSRDAEAFAAAFAGDDRYIVDYLMVEVLQREPEGVRGFLRQTCILERLSAPLCDALTGRDDGQAMLEQLEAANLFLIPLDNRREWYRYHVLFADMLRLMLGAQERMALHQKAAVWLEAHGLDELVAYHTHQVAELSAASGARGPRTAPQPLIEPLSEREIEVLYLIAQGYSNAEIARKLYITVGTVKRHINNIYGKLEARSRTQAVAIARTMGLVT